MRLTGVKAATICAARASLWGENLSSHFIQSDQSLGFSSLRGQFECQFENTNCTDLSSYDARRTRLTRLARGMSRVSQSKEFD